MLSPEQEEQVIAQALRKGLLKPEQVELHAPENRSTVDPRLQSYRSIGVLLPPPHQPQPTPQGGLSSSMRRANPLTYGPRLDRLRKLGLIDDATIEEIRGNLRSAALTAEATAVTSDEQPSIAGADSSHPTPPSTPQGAAPVPVQVQVQMPIQAQLPLPEPLRRWTRYEITDVLGQGGMGVVYKARDRRLGRTVALKFIRLTDPKMVTRFVNEARAQARITHDNICKVYEVDEVASQPYIAMEYVDGQSVLSLIDKLSLLQKVQIIQEVARALHSAHRIGIIHRDIKPQNVLVEQKADGRLRPVLMDFGLARDVRSRLNLTETGVVLGTPEYMSPEQARGTNIDGAVDCRTDVYSLGAMLYELLVGQPPFEGSSSVQVLLSVLNDEVIPVRMRNPVVPQDLEIIVMKCLSKAPDDRYPTARSLADELGRFLAGEPIIGQPQLLSDVSEPTLHPTSIAPQRIKVLLAGALLLVIGLLLVVVIRMQLHQAAERRFIDEQSRHAQLFEKDVREMELFMRAAYELPLHNIRSEQDQIRQRVRSIKSRLPTLGPQASGPGEYALGRAAMVLDQWPEAEAHLLAALRAGYTSAEVHFALGLTYGTRYQRAADEARRHPDHGWAMQRLKELETEFLVPARIQLEQSGGVALESPAYAQALLQYYRRQFDAALSSVSRAASEAPWLPEIVQLEARLLRERAAQSGPKELMLFGEYDLKRADQILGRAIDMARSNPFLYMEAAELSLLLLRQRILSSQPVLEPYQQVISACQKALVAQPDLAVVYSLMASAEAFVSDDQIQHGEDPRQSLERGQAALSEAQRLSPGHTAQLLTANHLNRVQIAYQLRRGQDALPALMRAFDTARDAAQRSSSWAALWVDLGRIHVLRADYHAAHGQEQRSDLEAAMHAFHQAMTKQPGEEAAHAQIGYTELRLAKRAIDHGEDPGPHLSKAREGFSGASLDDVDVLLGQVRIQLLEAEYKLLSSGDADVPIAAAVQAARTVAKQRPEFANVQRTLAMALRLLAQSLHLRGQDPSPALGEGLLAIQAGHKLRTGDSELLELEAELHLLAARWQQSQRRSFDGDLRHAQAALLSALQVNDRRAATYVALARVFATKAESASAQAATGLLIQGLEAAGKALDIAPGSAAALLVQGELLLGQALRASGRERISIAEPALAALNQALKLNPLFSLQARAARERAQDLLKEPRFAPKPPGDQRNR